MSRYASLVCMLALVLMSCGAMFAQTAALDVYQVTYFDNNWGEGAPLDAGTIRVINPGLTGSPISPTQGTLCANIYVFDDTQEMIECCSCPVTANGLLTISIQDLTENPLTVTPFRGVIKIVSTTPNPTCDPTTNAAATPDLRAFSTHLQNAAVRPAGLTDRYLSVTEDEFSQAPLSAVESSDLGTICSFVRYLGTGRGRCDDECDEPIGGD